MTGTQKTTPAIATCDGCARRFEIRPQAEIARGGELQFCACPHCGRRYEVAFVTLEGVRLRDLLRSIRSLRQRRDSDKLRAAYDRTLAAYQAEVHSRLPAADTAA